MRTNIMIDDELMTDVLKLTGIKSKREAVEQGLQTLLALRQQEKTPYAVFFAELEPDISI